MTNEDKSKIIWLLLKEGFEDSAQKLQNYFNSIDTIIESAVDFDYSQDLNKLSNAFEIYRAEELKNA